MSRWTIFYNRQNSSISYLQVILRVPVRVKYNTGVSSSEVNTQATSAGTQQEDEAVWVRLAEAIDGSLS